jgi:putative AdoMet-dependent methyltransferase
MSEPFPDSDFDAWAKSYDQDVACDRFPFTGYENVLATVVALARVQAGMRVLDLGTGTGNLAFRFAGLGCELWCTDFSEAMLAKARMKLPGAHFLLHDLRDEWPSGLPEHLDCIVSAYVFHHFEPAEKIRLVQKIISDLLLPGARLVIGDIVFPDHAAQEIAQAAAGDAWEQEFYWIADEALAAFKRVDLKVEYIQVSSCAGIFHLKA